MLHVVCLIRRKPFGQMTKHSRATIYTVFRYPVITCTEPGVPSVILLPALLPHFSLTFISGSAFYPFLNTFHYRFPGFVPRHHRSGFIRCKGRPLRLIRQLEVHFLQNSSFLRKSYWSLGKDHSNVLNLFCNSLNRSIISSKEGALV